MNAWFKQLIGTLAVALGLIDAPRLQPIPVRHEDDTRQPRR